MMGAMRGTTSTRLSVLDQGRGGSINDADRVWYEEGIVGSRRALVFTIPFSALGAPLKFGAGVGGIPQRRRC